MRNVILIIWVFTVTAAAYTPTGLSPEDIKAFNHCADAVTLDFDDFTNATASAFNEEIERIFDGDESVLFVTSSETRDDGKGNSNYTELSLGGGLDRLEAYAFEGLQTGPITVVGGYEENRARTKGDLYDVVKRTGGGSAMLSDPAGTMLGISADYAGKKETVGDGITAEIPSTGFDSGRITAAYRSHFWGTSKLSTKISDTYSRQTLYGPAVTDNLIEADTDFTFLWLGDNSLRGAVTLRQENVNDPGGDSVGVLFTRIVMDNDFRVSEKIRVGVGLGGFVLRRDSTLTRLYPRGSVHVGLTRHVGVFAKYRPYMRLPTFRELYYETDYSAAADYIPFTEAHGAFEIGVVNNVYDSLQTEVSFYEKRFRNDYARENVPGDFKTAYHDLGKYYNRGLSARAQLNFRRFVSIYGGYVYDRFEIIDVRGGHIPYRPSNTFTTGLLVGGETGYNVSAELKRVGERFGDATGTIILPPAAIADAALRLRLHRGITVYVKGENLNDATYNVIYGVPAPGRTISAGLKLVI
jgi:hypothetical protein